MSHLLIIGLGQSAADRPKKPKTEYKTRGERKYGKDVLVKPRKAVDL